MVVMCGGGVCILCVVVRMWYGVCGVWCEWCVWMWVGGLGHSAVRSGGAHPTPTDPPANTLSSHHRRLRAQTRNVQKTNGEKRKKDKHDDVMGWGAVWVG